MAVPIGQQIQVAWSVIQVVVIVFAFFLVLFTVMTYRYRILLRYIGPDGYVYRSKTVWAKAKENKETNIIELKRLTAKKHFIPMPPGKCITNLSTMLGQMKFAEFYVTENNVYAPIHTRDEVDEKQITTWDPVTKAQYVLEEKARLQKMQTWKQMIFPLTCLFIMAMLIISMMLFYGNVAAPLIKQAQENQKIAEAQANTAKSMGDAVEKMDHLLGNLQRYQDQQPLVPPPQVAEGGLG